MPNPASSTARNRTTHDTANRATPDTATSTSHATNSDPITTDQIDSSTTPTLTRIDDRTDQGKNQVQSTNRAGITMVRVTADSRVGDANPVPGMVVPAVAGGRHAA